MKAIFLPLICLSLAAQTPAPQASVPQTSATVPPQPVPAQAKAPEPPKRPWSNVTTLSYVATAGNAEGQTIGFGNEYLYKWAQSAFSLKAGAIRVNSTIVSRGAVGSSLQDYLLTENRTETTTAETYFLNARFDHRLKDKDRWYWYGGTGWERNRPAGLDNKYKGMAGFGRIWADSDHTKLRTDAGFGYTHEQPLAPPAEFQSNYGTFNLTSQIKQKIGSSSLYTVDLTVTDSLSDSQDYLGTLRQGLIVSINKTLALKIGYDVAYKSHPNLIPVDVFTNGTSPVNLGQISIPAQRTDTAFTTSLVITL